MKPVTGKIGRSRDIKVLNSVEEQPLNNNPEQNVNLPEDAKTLQEGWVSESKEAGRASKPAVSPEFSETADSEEMWKGSLQEGWNRK
ncbi:hypothetical protein KKH27_13475 [bacterium]|nr:hypothetical protein [bacterium]MBU1984608.1 hypothetical protein [bacterium]